MIKDIIAKATVFEEEDFQPLSYGFQLASDISEAKAMSCLKESEDSAQKSLDNEAPKSPIPALFEITR